MSEEKVVLRQGENLVQVEGYVISNNLEITTDKHDKELIRGTIEIGTDKENFVPVDVFSYKYTKEGAESKVFKALKTVMEQYVDSTKVEKVEDAEKVRVTTGNMSVNEFVGRDGNVAAAVKYGANFINRVTDNSFVPKATFRTEVFIMNVRPETKDGDETGRGFIDGLMVNYKGELKPVSFVADGKTWRKIEDNVEKGQTMIIWGDIINTVMTKTLTLDADFGESEETTITNTRRERKIRGCKYVEDDKVYEKTDVREALKEREAYLEQLKKEKSVNQNTPVDNKKEEKKDNKKDNKSSKNEKPAEDDFPWEDD